MVTTPIPEVLTYFRSPRRSQPVWELHLGIGLWLNEPAAKTYAHGLKDRGKHSGVVACALAHRANRIAYALVRDHATYEAARWA